MPKAAAHILVVASRADILRVRIDSQGTLVESADATLSRYRADDGDLHVLLRRADGKTVVDHTLRPFETVCYALLKPGKASATPHWQTVSAPETPVPPPPSRAVCFRLTAGSLALRTGLLWNLLIALPTLYYFCLPYGTAADADLLFVWLLPASAAVFLVGIPLYLRALLGRRAEKRSFGPEASALLFCVTPLFLALPLLYLAGVTRGLKTGCDAEDGTEITWQQQDNFDYKRLIP